MKTSGRTDYSRVFLLDYEEMASRLDISKRTLQDLVKRGLVPYIKVGKLIRFNPGEVIEKVVSGKCAIDKEEANDN